MRTLAKISCKGLEWTRLSVHPQPRTIQREDTGSVAACVDMESFVIWMMDMSRRLLDGRDLGKQDACLGGLHGFYTMGATSA
jgi:hypothetical protein